MGKRTKKLLSLVTSLALAASSFSAFVISASAAEETVKTYSWEAKSRVSAGAKGEDGMTPYTTANNAGNGYVLVLSSFADQTKTASSVKVEFDSIIPSGTRALVGFGDAAVRGTNANGSNKSTYNTDGLIMSYGTNDGNYFRVNGGTNVDGIFGNKVHTTVTLDKAAKKYSYSITSPDGATTYKSETDVETTVSDLSAIEAYSWVNNSVFFTTSDVTVTTVESEAALYKVTTQVTCDGEVVKESSEDVMDGTSYTPKYEQEFNQDGYKYTYVSGGEEVTITGETTIKLIYTKRALEETSYTIKGASGDVDFGTFATGTVIEDSEAKANYPKYVVKDGVLYEVAQEKVTSKNYYGATIIGTQEDQEIKVEYTKKDDTPVYYAEAEDLWGDAEVSNSDIRCSNGKVGTISEDTTVLNLSAGTYKITTAVWGGGKTDDSQSTYTFKAGTNSYDIKTAGSRVENTFAEFTLTEAADLVVSVVKGTSGAGIDYILITGEGTAATPEPSEEPAEPTDTPEPTTSVEPEEPTDTPEPTDAPTLAPATELGKMDVSGVAAGQKTKKIWDTEQIAAPTADDIARYSVEDFGAGKDGITEAIPALDGWGYKHYSFTALQSGKNRETSVTVDPETNTVYVNGVGNDKCDGAISYIPANDAGVKLPEKGAIIYTFDAVMHATADLKAAEAVYGFTSAANGASVVSEGSVSIAIPTANGETKTCKMKMVYDRDNGAYGIYVDGVLAQSGHADDAALTALSDITGIYAQAPYAGRYADVGIKDLVVSTGEVEPIPTAAPPTDTPEPKDTPAPTTPDPGEVTPDPGEVTPEPDVTPAPAGTVLYSQDYQEAADVDWKTSTGGRYDPLIVTEEDNKYLGVNQENSQRQNNGATLTSNDSYGSYVEGLSAYVVEFDAKLGSSNDQGGNADFRINTGDGYLLSVHQKGNNTTTWYLNGDQEVTVDLPGTATNTSADGALTAIPWYHFTVAFKDGATYLTVTGPDNAEILKQTLLKPNSVTGALTNMTFATGRYYANFGLDNLVIRTPKDGEIPDVKFYKVVINTTHYAKMTTSDGQTFYADENGVITLNNQTVGTKFDYELTKTGYSSATGSIEVKDADITEDKQLQIEEEGVIYLESDFGDEAGTYQTAKGDRLTSKALGTIELPDMSTVSMDVTVDGAEEKVLNIVLKNSAGQYLVGLQGLTADSSLNAFTDFTGSNKSDSDINQQGSAGAYNNGGKLLDNYVGSYKVEFVIDKVNKTVTVRIDDTTVSLPIVADPIDISSISVGKYRQNAGVTIDNVKIEEPDPNYVQVSGDTQLAKVSGKSVTRTYTATAAAPAPDETFTWSVTEATGVSISQEGVLTVTDAAAPGKITVTATSSASADKKGTVDVSVEDFANVTPTFEGPKAYNVGGTGEYTMTALVDEYGDNVFDLFTPTYSSSADDVITIDADGKNAKAVGAGEANIIAKVGNPGKEATVNLPVTVAKYYVTAKAAGDTTDVDISGIVDAAEYQVTTTDADGNIVKQYTITAEDIKGGRSVTKHVLKDNAKMYTAIYNADGTLQSVTIVDVEKGYEEEPWAIEGAKRFYWDENMKPVGFEDVTITTEGSIVTVDTTGATDVEIAPVYTTTMNAEVAVPAGTYNVTVTAGNGRRSDVYVNDQMLFNNINQGSDNWTISRNIGTSTDYSVEDVYIGEGHATFRYMDDQSSGSLITAVKFVKTPDSAKRATRIYLIGDSLVANYYGTAPEGQEGLVRTGWGQVFQDYVADGVKVTNLGNSGAWAAGMIGDAFTAVEHSAQEGDIVVWESGYNDRNHGGAEPMREAMTRAAEVCKNMGVDIYFVTPNTSSHDYTKDVVLSNDVRALGAELEVPVIDLSALSYKFLSEKYSGVEDVHTLLQAVYNNSGDTLHSTYNAANCWAAIVAQGLPSELTNTTHTYTFNDGTNDITVGVGLMPTAE